ncbi:MAG: type I restriction enzyme HsdR N-terminal domain-containing protein [Methylocella sp.]
MTLIPFPQEVSALVIRFEEQRDDYKSASYKEAQLRQDFINPFFRALGWDMDNIQGHAEAYRDVIHEDVVRIGGGVKAPDYSFRIGGVRKFFVESKKPSAAIKDNPEPAFQVRRYAWSAKLPLSILTNFDEFAVYDCRIKPAKDDPASKARVFYTQFTNYAAKWDWIASVFSKDAILKGSFDRYAEQNKAKRGTAEVDDDFLSTIETWRVELARNLALRNSKLTQRELNFAVQRIIDRIIFLRICEDRGIEPYGRLFGLARGEQIYARLCDRFKEADDRYNSGLFHFKNEPIRHELPDGLTLRLDLDSKLLRDVFEGLYYPNTPMNLVSFLPTFWARSMSNFSGR